MSLFNQGSYWYRQGRYGDPFPRLPEDLTGPPVPADLDPVRQPVRRETEALENRDGMVGEAGFEPATTSTQSLCTTGLCDSPNGPGLPRLRLGRILRLAPGRPRGAGRPFRAASTSPRGIHLEGGRFSPAASSMLDLNP